MVSEQTLALRQLLFAGTFRSHVNTRLGMVSEHLLLLVVQTSLEVFVFRISAVYKHGCVCVIGSHIQVLTSLSMTVMHMQVIMRVSGCFKSQLEC